MNRPRHLIGVLGTHTEVGKTWVGVQLLNAARRGGLRVAARKPVQSFAALDGAPMTDAELLAGATGEQPEEVCNRHRCYELPMAPPMAANCLGKPRIELEQLLSEITWPANIDLGLVESVGGPRSPLTHDADSVEFIQRLQPDRVLLVADAGLGSLNAIRLSLACLGSLPVAVVLNRFSAGETLHELNRSWLSEHYGIRTVTDAGELPQILMSNGSS